MRLALVIAACWMCASGCSHRSPRPAVDGAAEVLAAWTRAQLDLRTWRSCTRSAVAVDPGSTVVVYPVAADGRVGTVALEPKDQASDPALICLQLALAAPPEFVPYEGPPREVRLQLQDHHEIAEHPGG